MVQGPPEFCTCLAVRQAARHISQFYDRHLAPVGLKTTQFSILAKLKSRGPLTINSLANIMGMDRTTLGRNILPLERDGLVAAVQETSDRRRKTMALTEAGLKRFDEAWVCWSRAQQGFDAAFGLKEDAELRALMRLVTMTPLEMPPSS